MDLGTVTVQPSLGVRKLQAVMTNRVGVAPQQNSASLARPRRQRRVPLDDGADLAAAVLVGIDCYVLAGIERGRERRQVSRAGERGGVEGPQTAATRRTRRGRRRRPRRNWVAETRGDGS